MIDFFDSIKHFKPQEFDDPTLPGSSSNMSPEFVRLLDQLRDKLGYSLRINSGFRTEEHNKQVGGKPNSAHTNGVAADIFCDTSQLRFDVVKVALELGFKRIGIGENFVHLDLSFDLPQAVLWLYPKGARG